MRILSGLLSVAVVSGGLLAGVSAQADTAYHRVYRQGVTITDPFSILDTYQNNALRPEEFRKGNDARDFASVDMDNDGFLSRSEFYSTTAGNWRNTTELTTIAPAAGDDTLYYRTGRDGYYRADRDDIVYYRDGTRTTELTRIAPAAGGDDTRYVRTDYYGTARTDIVYRDDPCDNIARRNDSDCR